MAKVGHVGQNHEIPPSNVVGEEPGKAVCENIKKICSEKKWGPKELAQAMGYSVEHARRIFRGDYTHSPHPANLYKLAACIKETNETTEEAKSRIMRGVPPHQGKARRGEIYQMPSKFGSAVPIIKRVDSEKLFLDRFPTAKHRALLSGNNCNRAFAYEGQYIIDALKNGAVVKIMMIKPDSQAAIHQIVQVDPRWKGDETAFRETLNTGRRILRKLKADFPKKLDYKFFNFCAAFGLLIVDPEDENGIVTAELYSPYPTVGTERAVLYLPKSADHWRRFFIQQWTNYWDLAEEDLFKTK